MMLFRLRGVALTGLLILAVLCMGGACQQKVALSFTETFLNQLALDLAQTVVDKALGD